MHVIDAGLYWQLPGPRAFVQKIASTINSARVLVVNLPHSMVPGTRDGFLRGLHDAHIREPISITVRRGTDIASDVGMHFDKHRLTGSILAGVRASSETAVVLQAEDSTAQSLCEQYTMEFMTAVPHSHGSVRLVTTIHDPSLQGHSHIGNVQLITFDGGLTPDEMDAYVGLRMISRPGPGSTRLVRTIVSEFAGFDVRFAERLIHLDDSQILGIREQLHQLLGEDPYRWYPLEWLKGSASVVSSVPHVLHDFYLSQHGAVPQKEEAAERISRRYWRACLKAVTPWLEERRNDVLRHFHAQLVEIASKDPSHQIPVPIGNNKFRHVDPEEVEFNNIVGLHYAKKLHATSAQEQQALRICRSTKYVRDDIAHMRAPQTADLINLITEMDGLTR
jgi:hypothetical protein